MKYVIDIDNVDYEYIKNGCIVPIKYDNHIYDAIRNGKSLDEVLKFIDIGISASTGTDDYMVGFRNGMKWVKSLLDEKDPDYDSCISGKEQE